MCIVAGCDYLNNIRGIGINKARKLIVDESDFLSILQGMAHAPQEYSANFLKAKAIFLHQTVIDPLNGTTVPLTRWEDTPNFQKNTGISDYLWRVSFFILSYFVSPLGLISAAL